MGQNRILLGQLISNGDCLYATAIARQIKHDFPGAHLTWAISSLCRQMIEGNPFVDEIWEIPLARWDGGEIAASWQDFEAEALRRYDAGRYDFAFFTQITIGNPHHFDGTVRPGIFRGYPGRIATPLNPTLHLREAEIAEVAEFAARHHLASFERVILFECSSKSGQSQIDPEKAYRIAEQIVGAQLEKVAVILCSQHPVAVPTPAIIDGSVLKLRHMAELSRHCHLLIGSSSGISCITTSTAGKKLPMIQLLDEERAILGSLAFDYAYFGLPTEHVIEMFIYQPETVLACYRELVARGWDSARHRFHQRPNVTLSHYVDFVRQTMCASGDFYGACRSVEAATKRHGWPKKVRKLVRQMARKQFGARAAFWPYPKRLAQLKEHFHRTERPSGNGPVPSSWRPCTCEVALEKSPDEWQDLLKAQFGGGFSSTLLRSDLLHRILAGEFPDQAPGDRPPDQIARALSLFHHKKFRDARGILDEVRAAGIAFSDELNRLYADLCWIGGERKRAFEVYRTCLSRKPSDSRLPRLLDHLEKTIQWTPAQAPRSAMAGPVAKG